MKFSIELFLAIWGAVISTVLAIIAIIKELQQRPKLKIEAELLLRSCQEDEETHGVKISVKRGDDILFEEAVVMFTIRNIGLKSIQVNAIFVETENEVTQIIPTNFPATLESNTSIASEVQPEWFVPSKLSENKKHKEKLKPEKVISIGIFDALGNKRIIAQEMADKLLTSCKKLPLRIGVFKHKRTGNLVSAFQVKDKSILVKKK